MRRLVILLGPTGVGKTDLGIGMALDAGSPVISCDSRQIYREMTIGTAVPDASQLSAVKHYFIQSESVTAPVSAWDYAEKALELIRQLFDAGHETLVMAGGSMLWIDAVCKGLDPMPATPPAIREELTARLDREGLPALVEELRRLDPEAAARMDLDNPRRVQRALEVCLASGRPFSSFHSGAAQERDFAIEKIGLSRPREVLYGRINRRVDAMMQAGLLEEVRSLLPCREQLPLHTVGYRELFGHLDGKLSLDEAVAAIKQHTRNYAKRQMTWWRRDPDIHWKELS